MGEILLNLISANWQIAIDKMSVLLKQHSLAINYLAVYVASTSLLIFTVYNASATMAVAAPPIVIKAWGIFMPDNFAACTSALVSARIFSNLYLVKLRAASNLTNSLSNPL